MNAYWKGIVLGLVVLSAPVMAQEKPAVWDLKSCINYARAHNIQIRQSRIAWEESLENTKQAKADRLPSLSFTTAHNYVNRPYLCSKEEKSGRTYNRWTCKMRCRG